MFQPQKTTVHSELTSNPASCAVGVCLCVACRDEHPTGMMCDGILLQRPLSPLKHALSAVLQHLGGILPPHLGYNPGRKLVQHDWLWSVGGHPLSWTSWGGKFSQIHIDALHRCVAGWG